MPSASVFGIWSDSIDHVVHLLVAFFLALPIGWNRARAERGAGIRTFPLVAMAKQTACEWAMEWIVCLG